MSKKLTEIESLHPDGRFRRAGARPCAAPKPHEVFVSGANEGLEVARPRRPKAEQDRLPVDEYRREERSDD